MHNERPARSFLDPKVVARLSALPLAARRAMLGNVFRGAMLVHIAAPASSSRSIASMFRAMTSADSIGASMVAPTASM